MQRPLFKLAVAATLVFSLPTAMADVPPVQNQSARLLTALALIVPQPYEINVDNSIPTDTRLSWEERGDWQQQLRQAAESAGLGVRFNVPEHALLIFRLPRIHRVTVGSVDQGAQTSPPGAQYRPRMTSADDAWSMPAPAMPARTVHLIDAIQALMPPSLATTLQLEILATDLNTPAHWEPGTRWDALQTMLRRMGLQAQMRGMTLHIAPIGDSGGDAQTLRDGAPDPSLPPTLPASPASSAFQPIPLWTLEANQSISAGLKTWAQAAGWAVVWDLPQDWLVPNTTHFQGDFRAAATQVIQALAANGANVRATVYQGNKTLVVTSSGDIHK